MGSYAFNSPPGEKRTEIDVLVVGAGIGGLCCAIELHRQGHEVKVLEGKGFLDGIGMLPFQPRLTISRLGSHKFKGTLSELAFLLPGNLTNGPA